MVENAASSGLASNASGEADHLAELANKIGARLANAADNDKHGLRPHQIEAVKASAHHLQAPIGSEIVLPDDHPEPDDCVPEKLIHHHEIVSATGSGKTRILGALMDGSGEQTLILTPRLNLNMQAKKEFSQEMQIPESDIGIIDGDQTPAEKREALSKRCVISTYQSVSREGNDELRASLSKRPLILLDEAHTAQGPEIKNVLNEWKKNSIVIGVTATDAGVSQTLFDGQSPVFNLDLVTAIEHGLLATGVRTGKIDIRIDEDWAKEMAKTSTHREFSPEAIEKFAGARATLEAIAKTHLSYSDNQLGKISRFKAIVFTQGVQAAKDGAELFNQMAQEKGDPARAGWISGTMSPDEKKTVLEDFESGKITMLYNDRMLEMGYDLPEASIVYSSKPTNYRHTAEQQLGRVCRKQKKGFVEKYNMDKVALAINIVPKGVDPYTYAHVLGGRAALYAQGKEPSEHPIMQTPDKSEMDLEGLEFHMDYQDMEAVLADSQHDRSIPDAPSNFLTKTSAVRALRIKENKGFSELWNQLVDMAEAKGRVPNDGIVKVDRDGTEITLGYFRKLGGRAGWHVAEDSLLDLAKQLGVSAPKINHYLSMASVATELGRYSNYPPLVNAWRQLAAVAEKADRAEDGTVEIDFEGGRYRLQFGRAYGHESWFLHRDSVDTLRHHLGIALEQPSHFYSFDQAANHCNIPSSSPAFVFLRNELLKLASELPRTQSSQVTVDYNGTPITMGYYRKPRSIGEHWCIDRESIGALEMAISKSNLPKTPYLFAADFPDSSVMSVSGRKVMPADLAINNLVRLSSQQAPSEEGLYTIKTNVGPIKMRKIPKPDGGDIWLIDLASKRNFNDYRGEILRSPSGFLAESRLYSRLGITYPDAGFTKIWEGLLKCAEDMDRSNNGTVKVPFGEGQVELGYYDRAWLIKESSIASIAEQLKADKEARRAPALEARAKAAEIAAAKNPPADIRIYTSVANDPAYQDRHKTWQSCEQDTAALEAIMAKITEIAAIAKKHGLKAVDFAPYRIRPNDDNRTTDRTQPIAHCHYALQKDDTRTPYDVIKPFIEEVKALTGVQFKVAPIGRAKDAVKKENPSWQAIFDTAAKGRRVG